MASLDSQNIYKIIIYDLINISPSCIFQNIPRPKVAQNSEKIWEIS